MYKSDMILHYGLYKRFSPFMAIYHLDDASMIAHGGVSLDFLLAALGWFSYDSGGERLSLAGLIRPFRMVLSVQELYSCTFR